MSETKLGGSFPANQFHLNGYKTRARKYRNKFDGGLMELELYL